jgi:YbaB/EbfC DNA-binding family protein
MLDGRDLAEAARLIDCWRPGAAERRAQARELSSRLRHLRETARSADGSITVSVGAAGDLLDLSLGEGALDRTPAVLAAEIMATVGVARAALLDGVAGAAAATVGAESMLGQVVVRSFAGRYGCGDPEV